MNMKTWYVIDRPAILDLKLTPPTLTKKYVAAVDQLSKLDQVSPYFFHVLAARRGHKVIYAALRKCGYRWMNGTWKK